LREALIVLLGPLLEPLAQGAASAAIVRSRFRSTRSLASFFWRRIRIERSVTVSGSCPIPAIAFAQNVLKSSTFRFVPLAPTQRE
jgi:hypothetical protein